MIDDLISRLDGRAAYCRYRNEIKTPEPLDEAAEALILLRDALAGASPYVMDHYEVQPNDETLMLLVVIDGLIGNTGCQPLAEPPLTPTKIEKAE